MGLVGLRFWNQVIFQLLAILSIFTACCILLEDFFELWLLDERFRIVLESSFVGLLLDVDSDFNIIGVDAIQCGFEVGRMYGRKTGLTGSIHSVAAVLKQIQHLFGGLAVEEGWVDGFREFRHRPASGGSGRWIEGAPWDE